MSRGRVLIVDDEPDMVENCARILKREGYECLTATDGRRALEIVESARPDLLLTDLSMPELDGMALLRRAHEVDPALPVIMITAFASIESAVAAVKEGAFDYLPKTFSVDQLRVAVERAVRHRSLQVENRNLRAQLQETLGLDNIIGRSPAMTQVFELVKKAARSEANILVLGESGTGKELIARAIHANSPRAGRAFVPVDCASLPEQLLESELFGHEKGAFTGADRTKPGLIEVAHRGTLFLDEIAELPSPLQVKLLRALQERQIRRVGSTSLVDVDVRFVSATNRDLRDAIAEGTVPRGALLSRERDCDPTATAARARGRREAAGARLPEEVRAGTDRGDRGRGDGGARGLSLAGQCPRAAKCPRARVRACRGQDHHAPGLAGHCAGPRGGGAWALAERSRPEWP